MAVDISPDALDLARENAVGHARRRRVRFEAADLLPPHGGPAVGRRGRQPAVRPRPTRWPSLPAADDLRAAQPPSTAGRTAWPSSRGCSSDLPAVLAPGGRRAARDRRGPGRGDRGAGRRAAAGLVVHGRAGPGGAAAHGCGSAGRAMTAPTAASRRRRGTVGPRPVADRPAAVAAPEFPIRLIALDIDGTLIGDDHDHRATHAWPRCGRRWPGTSRSRSSPGGWCRRPCDSPGSSG